MEIEGARSPEESHEAMGFRHFPFPFSEKICLLIPKDENLFVTSTSFAWNFNCFLLSMVER
jgi:hypothetical protein